MAGLPKPEACQGMNLVPWLTGKRKECPSGPAPLYHIGLRWEGWKLYNLKESFYLYDLSSDPGEQVDLFHRPDQSERVREMKDILQRYAAEDSAIRRVFQSHKGEGPVLSPEELEKLRSLGYIK